MEKIGKKSLALLVAVLLLVATAPVVAVAADTITLTVTPSKTTALVGEEITYTVTMGSAEGSNLTSIQFFVDIPSGLSYKPGSGVKDPNFQTTTRMAMFDFDEEPRLQVFGQGDTPYNGTNDINVLTFVCTVAATGNQTVTPSTARYYENGITRKDFTVIPATIAVNQLLSNVDILLTAPAVGAAPQTTVSGTGYSGTVSWNDNPATFAPSTVYTATVALTASEYYVFGSDFTPTVNTALNGTVTTRTESQLVFTVTFPSTPDRTDISDTIIFNGASYQYDGAPKALPGATTTDTSGGTFTYSYAGADYPASANAPTNAGTYTVTANYSSFTATGAKTATMTITPIALTITGVTAADRAYDGTTDITLSGGTLAGVLADDGDAADVSFVLGSGSITDPDVGLNKSVTTNIALTGAKSGNYTLAQPTALTVDISKADFSYNIAAAQNIKIGGGLSAIVAPEVGIGIGGATVAGTLEWFSDAARTITAVNTDLTGLAVDAVVTLFWRFTPGNTNYQVNEGSTVFTIVSGDPQPLAFATPGTVTKRYGDAVFTNVASHVGGSDTKGAITYASDNMAVATVDPSTGAVTIVGVGTAAITATAADVPGLWVATSESYTITVNKAAPAVGDFDYALPGIITYDALPHSVAVSVKSGLTGFGSITAIKYNNVATAPIDADTYALTVDVDVGDNYEAATVSLGNFTIAPKALTNAMLTITDGPYVYDGSAKTPTYTVADGNMLTVDDYSVTALPAQTNAGSYALTIAGRGNYIGTATQNFIIERIAPAAGNLNISVPTASDYDGSLRAASVTAGTGKSGLGAVTILYDGATSAPVNAGTYVVTANIAEGENYNQVTGLVLGTILINKKTVTGVAGELRVKSGAAKSYDFDLTALLPAGVAPEQVSAYSFVGKTGDAILDGTPTINGRTLTLITLGSTVGDDTETLEIGLASGNYTISNAVLTITAVEKSVVAVSGVTVSSRAYNGDAIVYDAAELSFTDVDTDESVDLEPIFSWSGGSTPVNAGSYTLTVSADGGGDYEIIPLVIDFEITKAPLTLEADDKDITVNSALPTFTFTVTGLISPDTWQSVSEADPTVECATANAAAAGAYPITIEGGDLNENAGANYEIVQRSGSTLTVSSGGGGGGTSFTTYTVTFNSNGGSDVPNRTVAAGGRVTRPTDPVWEDYTFDGWYSDADMTTAYDFGSPVNSNITLYAKWTGSITDPDTPLSSLPFSDINMDDWFYGDVEYVFGNGLMKGTSLNKFSPDISLTRGMIVTILYRHAGSPDVSDLGNPFSDVREGEYYTDAVKWAARNGIVLGYDGKFNPDAFVTRQDLAVILFRYANFADIELPKAQTYPGFIDDADIANYAKEAVKAYFEAQIIDGKPGNRFDPRGNATRAEAAAMIHRFLENAIV